MLSTEKPSRPRCERCQRPLSHCLCAHISVIDNRTRVLILQHPDEARHPLNTARLALLGLRHADLLVGKAFPQVEDRISSAGDAVLLFPSKEEGSSVKLSGRRGVEELPTPEKASPWQEPIQNQARLLIVPDGTWRKARQIVNGNAALHSLPRLHLHSAQKSGYIVRKAREPQALSTIEAIVHALGILEPEQDFQPLLKPFHALVDQQIKAMGPQIFEQNYLNRS